MNQDKISALYDAIAAKVPSALTGGGLERKIIMWIKVEGDDFCKFEHLYYIIPGPWNEKYNIEERIKKAIADKADELGILVCSSATPYLA